MEEKVLQILKATLSWKRLIRLARRRLVQRGIQWDS